MAQKLAIWPVEPIRDGLLLGHAIKTRLLRCINSVSQSAKYLFLPLHIYQHQQLGVVNSGRSYFNFTIHNEQKKEQKQKSMEQEKNIFAPKVACIHIALSFTLSMHIFFCVIFTSILMLCHFLMALIPISDLNIIHRKKNSTRKKYFKNQNFVIFG